MKKRLLALLLSVLMLASALPFMAFADEEPAAPAERTEVWNSDYSLLLEKLFNNEESAHWRYVAENNKEISDTMLTYTVFALYDDAWKNGIDRSISVDRAEQILCSLIEKVDTGIGDSKVKEIQKVLQGAVSFNDLLQKVNSYVEISDVLSSTEWSTAFQYIEWAIEVGDLYDEARDRVIEAYAQILAVQAANDYYLDFLSFLSTQSTYSVVRTAASNLIGDINSSIEDIVGKEVLKALGFTASNVLETAARIAMETNSYTAVALKVYDIGTSVADKLWNTGDQYAIMDQLYTTFFVETGAVDWARIAGARNDKDKFVFAVSAVLSLREAGADSLYMLKVKQSGGVIGRIKNQINRNVSSDNVSENAFLAMTRQLLFTDDLSNAKKVNSIVTTYGDFILRFGDTAIKNGEGIYSADNCLYSSVYDDYAKTFVKTVFLYTNEKAVIEAAGPSSATLIIKRLGNHGIEDWSFSGIGVFEGYKVSADTVFSQSPRYYVEADGEISEFLMNDDFVYPAENPVTGEAVVTAVGEIAAEETIRYVSAARQKILDFIEETFYKILYILFPFMKK